MLLSGQMTKQDLKIRRIDHHWDHTNIETDL